MGKKLNFENGEPADIWIDNEDEDDEDGDDEDGEDTNDE